MFTAEEMRARQKEIADYMTYDRNEVTSLCIYIQDCLNKMIEYPSFHEITIPKDILSKYSRGSILKTIKLLKEDFKYDVEYVTSRDLARSVETLTIRW